MCDGVKELQQYEQQWHLDKRVPIAIIITLIGQVGLGLIVGTLMWAQINVNTRDILDLKMVMPHVYRMVENTDNMAEDINELKGVVKDLAEKLREQARNGK